MTVINKNAGHQSSQKKKKKTNLRKTTMEFFFYTARTLEPAYIMK